MADELLPLLGIHVPPNDDDSSDSNSGIFLNYFSMM
jgi:hypothetical protein